MKCSKGTVYACSILSKTPLGNASSLHTIRDGISLSCWHASFLPGQIRVEDLPFPALGASPRFLDRLPVKRFQLLPLMGQPCEEHRLQASALPPIRQSLGGALALHRLPRYEHAHGHSVALRK